MRDREEQVNYGIDKSAQQDEASYDNEVKVDQYYIYQRAEEEERQGR